MIMNTWIEHTEKIFLFEIIRVALFPKQEYCGRVGRKNSTI